MAATRWRTTMQMRMMRGVVGGMLLLAAVGWAAPGAGTMPENLPPGLLQRGRPPALTADGRITPEAVVEQMASGPGAVARLRGQLTAAKEVQARAWLRAALVKALYASGRRAEAWQERIDGIEESAATVAVIELGFSPYGHERAQAEAIWTYVCAKVRSPAIGLGSPFEYDVEKNELRRFMGASEKSLTAGDVAYLAERIRAKEPATWTPDETVGAHFVQCLAEAPDRERHLEALVQLGLKHEELAEKALWMVTLLPGDNGAAWPLIIKYLPDSFGKPASTRDIAARDALIAIHARPKDVVALAQRTTDDHVLIASMKAIKETHDVPADVKEAMIGLEGRMAKFDSEYTQYLQMVAGWGKKELDLLGTWMEQRPAWAMRMGAILAERGDMRAVERAVTVYNSMPAPSDGWAVERRELSKAAEILSRSTDPKVWGRLKYRADLPEWDNARLLQFVRRQPPAEAEPLLEAFRRQYPKGGK